jgi:formylglycine-generating enzyme required for sulfatase activity
VYGIEDMIGNVWEFVDAPHTPSAEERNHIKTEAGMPWIKVYGGAFQGPLSEAWDPAGVPVDHRTNNLGFRCAADPRR